MQNATQTQTTRGTQRTTPQNFLLVDDHPMLREVIGSTLETILPGSATDLSTSMADTLRRLATSQPYDFIVLDLRLPDSSGFDSLAQMRLRWPDTSVIVLSGDTRRDTIMRCLDMGAVGYIPKTLHPDVIAHALRLILSGQIYVPHEAVSSSGPGGGRGDPYGLRPIPLASGDPRALGLTERQIDVLRLLLRGLPNKLICRELDLAEGTVKVHVSAVLRALGARTRTQAVIAAREMGLRVDH